MGGIAGLLSRGRYRKWVQSHQDVEARASLVSMSEEGGVDDRYSGCLLQQQADKRHVRHICASRTSDVIPWHVSLGDFAFRLPPTFLVRRSCSCSLHFLGRLAVLASFCIFLPSQHSHTAQPTPKHRQNATKNPLPNTSPLTFPPFARDKATTRATLRWCVFRHVKRCNPHSSTMVFSRSRHNGSGYRCSVGWRGPAAPLIQLAC
jgi:hypothetical protein